jgi:hypothetical protein
MEYRIRSSGDLKTQGELRQMHPNTSLPKVWDQATLEYLGVDPVFESPAPATTRFQSASKTGVVQDSLGNWVWAWTVTDWDQEAIDAATQQQATAIRATRDQRLAETDWLVIKAFETNTNIPGVWEVYRQALRDVPAQAGFPFEVTWPEKP